MCAVGIKGRMDTTGVGRARASAGRHPRRLRAQAASLRRAWAGEARPAGPHAPIATASLPSAAGGWPWCRRWVTRGSGATSRARTPRRVPRTSERAQRSWVAAAAAQAGASGPAVGAHCRRRRGARRARWKTAGLRRSRGAGVSARDDQASPRDKPDVPHERQRPRRQPVRSRTRSERRRGRARWASGCLTVRVEREGGVTTRERRA